MPEFGNVLAFDFGLKRIGVAVGQPITQTATPLATLQADNGKPDWDAITKLIKQWSATALVVGLPLATDGSPLHITPKAAAFAQILRDKHNLPVFEVNEELTTKEARAQVFKQGGYKALKKEDIDSIAAVIILEQWLGTL